MKPILDMPGKKFGRLTVVSEADSLGTGKRWLCECECGNTKIYSTSMLGGGHAISCGCYMREKAAIMGHNRKTHGMSQSRLYNIWANMKARCYNPSHNRYYRYGARGVTVCDEWRDSFEAFRDWALKAGYQDGLSIDREDNDGPYSPENCRWATGIDQANNTSRRKEIEFDGKKMSVAEWSRFTGLPDGTIRWRLSEGWDVSRALTKGATFAGANENK